MRRIYSTAFRISKKASLLILLQLVIVSFASIAQSKGKFITFPDHRASEVNPDTYIRITFNNQPILHNKGKIRIFDASNDQLVDELDMSIAPGPKNTRTSAPYDSFVYTGIPDSVYTVAKPDIDTTHVYQVNFIGGKKIIDAYHFYPVLIEGNTAKIILHNNKLSYNKTYYVLVDQSVFTFANEETFSIDNKSDWIFATKRNAPPPGISKLIVSADGKGDFTTIQGAIDFISSGNAPVEIYIRNGIYDEIVNYRGRNKASIIGESREGVIIRYANNGVFNLRAMSADPNLSKGVHNIRAVMAVYDCSEVSIRNLTLRSLGEKPAQAEALLVMGDKITVDNVSIEGSGDALQATGRIYVRNSKIQGFGDNVLGYGAVYFDQCDFVSSYGPHLWVRNTDKNHGNVLVGCTLRTIGDVETDIARAPDNHGIKYPYAEAVLIDCKIEGIRPNGWGKVTDSTEHIRYWEYNTTDLNTGKPIDTSKRHPASRQLTMDKDASLIQSYRDPAFVLSGWKPEWSMRISR